MFPSQFANMFLTYQKSVTNLHLLIMTRIALQVARKIAPCNRALRNESSAIREADYFEMLARAHVSKINHN